MSYFKNIFSKAEIIIKRYPIVTVGVILCSYYLLISINLFQTHNQNFTFIQYLLQFDSLIFMWLAFAVYMAMQRTKQEHQQEIIKRYEVEKQIEIQNIHTRVINEISTLLQDNVNNPLAVISITSKEIRRRFEKDQEIIRWLDRIDSSMQRIHNTIRDIQLYQTQKIVEESNLQLRKESKN